MPAAWVRYFLRLTALAIAGLVIGWLYDYPLIGLLIAVGLELIRQLAWLYRMDRWVHGAKMVYFPTGSGVWARVFARVQFFRDRSKRRSKRFKKLVREMQRATRAFPDGGIIVGNDNEIIAMNKAAENLLGLKRKQDRGLRIENLIRDPGFVAYLGAKEFGEAIQILSPVSSDCWLSCQLVPYGIDQRLLLIRDITQQVKADRMRRDFVANASHELRTPLTVITGYIDALIEEPGLDETLHEPLQEMQQQSDRMRTLTHELLRLSELESEGLAPAGEPVNIGAIMETARQEARAMEECPGQIEIEVKSGADLRGDAGDIQSIVSNLVSNAARYTPVDGKITIIWNTDEAGGHLTVTDTGTGISAEHLPRITERFYRVENGRERIGGSGTGLGLAIVKHALYRHSGRLDIESQAGKGSSFICHFPKARIAAVS